MKPNHVPCEDCGTEISKFQLGDICADCLNTYLNDKAAKCEGFNIIDLSEVLR